MTKTKSTKRALLMSGLALLMCVSMLIGSTFAWFTDSVTTGSNVIQSGKLDIVLEYWNGTEWADAEGKVLEFERAYNSYAGQEILWEPGCTFNMPKIRVRNEGNLAAKVVILVNGISGDDKLLEALTFTTTVENANRAVQSWLDVNGSTLAPIEADIGTVLWNEGLAPKGVVANNGVTDTTAEITLSAHMDENAGNEYQGLTVEGISITALATQTTYESDSFNDQYDANANYPGMVSNAAELAVALKEGGNIKLANNITLTEVAEVPAGVTAVLDLNGNTLEGDIIAPSANLTITNGTINDTTAANSGIEINAGTLNLENVNIISDRHAIRIDGDVTATINGGTYKVTGEEQMTTHALNVSGNANVTVNGGTFIGIKGTPNGAAMGGAAVNVQAGATVTINGGNFSGGVNDTLASNGTLIVKGGTFDQNPSKYVASGYIVTDNADGNYTVSAKISTTNEDLDAAIKAGDTTVTLADGNYVIPDSAQGKTLTIVGNGNTVVATQDDGSYEGCDYSLQGSTVTFENITINTDSSTYTGYARLNATYNNCTINGTYTLYGDSVFNDCTFNVSGDAYNIWTWGAPNATFDGCTFNSDGKALLLYGTVDTNLTVNNCVFNDNGGLTDLKAAIEIGDDYDKSYTLTVNNTDVNGYEINDKGINTGSTLWANKNSMGTDKLNVVIDGVDVY